MPALTYHKELKTGRVKLIKSSKVHFAVVFVACASV